MSNFTSDRELAKILVRAFATTLTIADPTASLQREFTDALMKATGGCPVKTMLALEIVTEVAQEIRAEKLGLAVQNVKPTQEQGYSAVEKAFGDYNLHDWD